MKNVNKFLLFPAMIFILGCAPNSRCYDSARSALAFIQSIDETHDIISECYAHRESCDKDALRAQFLTISMLRIRAEEEAKLCLPSSREGNSDERRK